ncbi:MAG: TraI domain-containing protein [Methyloprofundus sp.]|nr:TraI domain-containing protein [Methyloprofundus sp.]
MVDELRVLTGVPDNHFDYLYLHPLHKYIEYIQLAPASESHHHAELGGMVEHTLEVLINALRLRRGQILPTGVTPEEIEQRKDIWTFVVFACALLHDAGKLISDMAYYDDKGNAWGLLSSTPPPSLYRIKYDPARRHKFHERLAPFALYKVFQQGHVDWVMSDNEAWFVLVSFLTADFASASVVADIVQKADQASVVANLGGSVNDAIKRPVQTLSLSERLLKSLQQLVDTDGIGINKQGAVGYIDGDYVYFLVKPMLDKVKEKMRDQGMSVPASNNTLMGELQQTKVVESNGEKATFKVRVNVGDWQQDFSVLKMRVMKVWPTKRPAENSAIRVIELDEQGEPKITSHVAEKPTEKPVPVVSEPVVDQSIKASEKTVPKSKPVSDKQPSGHSSDKKDALRVNTQCVNDEDSDIALADELAELDALLSGNQSKDADKESDFSEYADDSLVLDESDIEEWSSDLIANDGAEDAGKDVIDKPESDNRAVLMDEINTQVVEGPRNYISRYNDEALDTAISFQDLDDPGAQFIGWLKTGLKTGALPLNVPGGPVHFVKEGLLIVSPQIFRTFQSETGIGWSQAQRSVTKSSRKINLKTPKGENMFTYEIQSKTGRNKDIGQIKGILIPKPAERLGLQLDERNEWMRLVED